MYRVLKPFDFYRENDIVPSGHYDASGNTADLLKNGYMVAIDSPMLVTDNGVVEILELPENTADWSQVHGISDELSNALHYMGLHTKDDLLAYFLEYEIKGLTAINGIGMKRAKDLIAWAQRG